MDLNNYAVPLIALVGTLFGGAGLEFVKRWLSKAQVRDNTAAELRNELRADLTAMRQELNDVEKEVTQWKNRYYEVIEQKIATEQELFITKQQLKARPGGDSDE